MYIGQTIRTLEDRWKEHLNRAKLNDENKYLYNAMNFYGHNYFVIEEIEKCPREKLNGREIFHIKHYKSYVNKYGPKYGYNLTPGGQGGTFNYKVVDKKKLKSMIESGLTSKEIGKALGIHKTTVSEKTQEFWAVNLSEMRSLLIKKTLKAFIKKGLTTQEIADELEWSTPFVYEKTKRLWNKSLNEVRKSFMNEQEYRIFLERDKILRGYKEIDESLLYNLLIKGYMREELLNRLEIGINTLYRRLYEFWGFSMINQFRQAFFDKNDWKNYKGRLKQTQPSYIKVDEIFFIKLIKKGLNQVEIANELTLTPWTVNKKAKELWVLTFIQAKKHFIKPYLKSLILLMFTDKQIAEELNISVGTLYRWLKTFWGITLIEARHKFIEKRLRKLIIQHKTAKEIAIYLNMSEQTVQNRVRDLWGMKLRDAWKHFIKTTLKDLIIKNLTAGQISAILNIDDSTVFHLTKEFWGKTLREAWRYFVKPYLKKLINDNYSANEIAEKLNIDSSTVYKLTKEFWNVRFSEAKEFL